MGQVAICPSFLRTEGDARILLGMIESLRETAPDLELLVIDDCSPNQKLLDDIQKDTSRLNFEFIRQDENQGFSRTVNVGLRRAKDENRDAILVNADIKFIEPGWAEVMAGTTDQDGNLASVVGALLIYPNNLIQHAGIYFSFLHRSFDHFYRFAPFDLREAQDKRVCPVTGALQFIRAETLSEVGVYDETFRMGWEDVDYCIRVFNAGGSCVYNPRVRAFHLESVFRGRPNKKVEEWQNLSLLYFMEKWRSQSFAQFVPPIR